MSNRFRSADFTVFALASMLLLGCGGDAGGDAGGGDAQGGAEPAAAPFDESTAGNVSGMVMFTGTAPAPSPIDMSDEPVCADKYDGGPMSQEVLVADGHLANVFVYVREGLEGMTFPTPSEGVVVDQDGCRYVPHVSGVMAGQAVVFENSDGILHNINATPEENRGFNISQPVEMTTERTFAVPEVMVPIRCDVHGWMGAYIGVVAHPYHAVTGEGGTFDLSTLPPGDYVIEAWHERYGTRTANVTVVTGETAQVNFEFDDSTVGTAPLGEPIDPHDHGTPVVAAGGGG